MFINVPRSSQNPECWRMDSYIRTKYKKHIARNKQATRDTQIHVVKMTVIKHRRSLGTSKKGKRCLCGLAYCKDHTASREQSLTVKRQKQGQEYREK